MDTIENRNVYSITEVDDTTEFIKFQQTGSFDLAIVPEPYDGIDELVMKPQATDFAKWLKKHEPGMKVELRPGRSTLVIKVCRLLVTLGIFGLRYQPANLS